MRRFTWLPAVAVAGSAMAADLPIKRVSLYSSGVGFFQRAGSVTGDDSAELKFKTAQINDILKSLVLQDLDGGTISAVTYASRDPVGKALKSFAVDITDKPTLGELLDQLRGIAARLEWSGSPEPLDGVIVGVEKQKKRVDDETIEFDVVTVLTEQGLQSVALPEVRRIKLLDEKLDAELRKALATLAASKDADKKSVVLSFSGQGTRRVRASYILETPIWKTSYRLVLDEQDKPLLQGWATVENTTDEDWMNVRLSLISGRPISFIQDLYQPLYMPRPVVKPELYASLRPQMYGGAMDEEVAGEPVAMAKAAPEKARKLGRRTRVAAPTAAVAEARVMKVEADAFAGAAPPPTPAGFREGTVASIAQAAEVGELFAYHIDAPVTLPRQKSAMLPIVNEPIEAEKVSIYNPAAHPKFALNGLWLTNSTGKHLMHGPATVFDGNTYAGDARLDDVQPGEKRLISYAMDLACEVEMQSRPIPETLVSIRLAKGTLVAKRRLSDARTYVIKNRDEKGRSVVVEQPFDASWKLIEPAKPFERTRDMYRFRVEVEPGKTAKLPVRLERTVDQVIALMDTGLEAIRIYLRNTSLSPAVKTALETVVRMRTEIDGLARRHQAFEKEIKDITAEQKRIRDNMGRLRQNSELYNRYIKKLDQQETRIENIQEELATLRDQHEEKRKALESYLLSVNVE